MAVKYCTGKRQSTAARPTRAKAALYQQQASSVQDVLHSGAQGTVSRRSSLAANTNGAPADPRTAVDGADGRANGLLTSASIFSFLDSMGLDMNLARARSASMQAYLDRFDVPEAVGARFRNRFTGDSFATQNEAEARELESLSTRFDNLLSYLDAGIRYVANDSTRVRLGTCRDRCSAHPGWGAWTCAERATHAIALCPIFWSSSTDEQAVMIVHELAHQRYGLTAHNFGSQRQRARNPECYASYIADAFGFAPFSGQCPTV